MAKPQRNPSVTDDPRAGRGAAGGEEGLYQALFENAGAGMMVIEEDMTIVRVNDHLSRSLGYAREEIEHRKKWPEMVSTEDRAFMEEQHRLRRSCPEKATSIYECRLRHRSGDLVPHVATVSMLPGSRRSVASMIDITERKRVEKALRTNEERLAEINLCLSTLGADYAANVERLTALSGRLLGAACALYNRLEGDLLCSLGQWHTPPDYHPKDRPEGHLCYDVIRKGGEEPMVVRHLPETPYAASDPNVARYGLKSYMGHPVQCAGDTVGAVCVVYQADCDPTPDDRRMLGLIASALSREEERRRADRELRESHERLLAVMDSMEAFIYIADLETCELLFVNEYGKRAWKNPGLLGQPCWRALQGRETPCPYCTNDRLLGPDGQPAGVYQWEFQNPVNGRWYDLRDRAIRWTDGRLVRMEIATDITERKQAEAALRESEEKFHTLFAGMTEMVALHEVVTDGAGRPVDYRVLDCNPAYTAILGIARERAAGRLASEVYGQTPPPYLAEYAQVAETGGPCRFEMFYAPLDKHFSISVAPMGRGRFATITSDLTEIQRTRRLMEEKNRELERILYVASHDLRSPLVNVDGYGRELEFALWKIIQMLECEEGTAARVEEELRAQLPEMMQALRHIRGSSKQMDRLLKGLLKLSRSGRMALAPGPLDMNALVGRVAVTFQYQLQETGTELRVESLPPCRGDALQTEQVFANLIGNAIKFRDPRRPGRVTVSGTVQDHQSVYVVEDNGIGIPPEHREKIFDLFHRVDPENTEGEGLGLTIVQQSLGRMGGEIRVESEPGAGSRFSVVLPRGAAMDGGSGGEGMGAEA